MVFSFQRLRALLASGKTPVSHAERIIAALGGVIGIFVTLLVTRNAVGPHETALVFAPIGASAVLLFAVPHGPLSQPWSIFGGHLISAAIGVTCFHFLGDSLISASLAVGLAIGAMYYLRCLHPPGGATALVAVVGGAPIHALGYQFLLAPVLVNAVALFLCAVAINYSFAWRRYPARLAPRAHAPTPAVSKPESEVEGEITHGDLAYALRQLDSFVDVTEEDLTQIYALAVEHAHQAHMEPSEILHGRVYSNGRYSEEWSLRQIVDESGKTEPDKDIVIYKVVAGKGRRSAGTCSRQEFSRWARYEVFRNENSWHKIERPLITDGHHEAPAALPNALVGL